MAPELRSKFLNACEEAIRGQHIDPDLKKVVLQMRAEDISQQEAYDIVVLAKETATGSKFFEGDPSDDAICDILDGITGFCAASGYVWSLHFDAKHMLAELEEDKK